MKSHLYASHSSIDIYTECLKISSAEIVIFLFEDSAAISVLGVYTFASDLGSEETALFSNIFRIKTVLSERIMGVCYLIHRELAPYLEPFPEAPQRVSRMCGAKSCSDRSRILSNYIMIASPPNRPIRQHAMLPLTRILRGEKQTGYI